MGPVQMNLNASVDDCNSNVTYTVRVSKSKAVIVWVINDFSKVVDLKVPLKGPRFEYSSATWEILMGFGGEFRNNAAGKIQFLLHRISSSVNNHLIKMAFGFQDKLEREVHSVEVEDEFCQEVKYCGPEPSVELKDILEGEIEDVLCNDTLIVYCRIKNESVIGDDGMIEEIDMAVNNLKASSRDFEKLYYSSDYSDVVLKTGKQELSAHRAILGARSNVFSDMFKQNSPTNEYIVDDVDSSTLEELLVYIYCGKIKDLSSDNVCNLYAAADKFALEELKELCLLYIQRNLAVDNVCNVLTLCEKYDLSELSSMAEAFFHKRAAEVIDSKEWAYFEVNCPDLALTLFRSFVRICKIDNEAVKNDSPSPATARRIKDFSPSADSFVYDLWWKLVIVISVAVMFYYFDDL